MGDIQHPELTDERRERMVARCSEQLASMLAEVKGWYPEGALTSEELKREHGNFCSRLGSLASDMGYTSFVELLYNEGFDIELDRRAAKNPVGHRIAPEDAVESIVSSVTGKLGSYFEKIDEWYPDRVVAGFAKLHGKTKDNLSRQAQMLGYESWADLLRDYGYEVPDYGISKGGAPRTVDPVAIVDELARRYEGREPAHDMKALRAENPDLASKFSTIANQSQAVFGKTLGEVLAERGVLSGKGVRRAKPEMSLEMAEEALVALEVLVASDDPKPATLAALKKRAVGADEETRRALDSIEACSREFYGKTPASLLKSRGILASRTATVAEPMLSDQEIESLISRIRERYTLEVRPTTLSELTDENPDLAIHMKQVKRYVSRLGGGSAMKYFEEEGVISKCRMEGSIPRPHGDVIERYHSDSRMTKEDLLALAPGARFVEFDTVCMVYEDEGEPEAYEMLRVGDYLNVAVKWLPELGREPDGLPYGRIHFHFCGHDLGIIKYQDQMDHLSIVGCAGKPEAYGTVGGRVFAQVTGLANGKKAPRVPIHVLYAVDKDWTGAAATTDGGATAGAASRYSYPTGSTRPQPVVERRPIAALADPGKLYASVSEHRFSYGGERGFEYTFWLPEGGESDDLAIANSYLRALEY
ncbi:MAG: hypothetical protein J6D54_10905 [Olsenella sp.]|nr:hypothetical protein [Olsenella sp.]